MKFVIAVVMLALALGAQSSLLPISYLSTPLSYTAVSGPSLYAAAPAAIALHAAPAAVAVHAAPAAVAIHAAPAAYIAAPTLIQAEGTYVAKNRGAVHVAPLPGHANSAASVNLEAAPGTI